MRDQFLGGWVAWKVGRSMLRYGVSYVLVGLLTTLLVYMDRLVLGWRASVDEIGVYSVAIKYAGLVEMALMGFKMAWWPFALASYSASGDGGLFGRTLSAYVVAVGCLIVGLYSLSEIGIGILGGAEYAGALVLYSAATAGRVRARTSAAPQSGDRNLWQVFLSARGKLRGHCGRAGSYPGPVADSRYTRSGVEPRQRGACGAYGDGDYLAEVPTAALGVQESAGLGEHSPSLSRGFRDGARIGRTDPNPRLPPDILRYQLIHLKRFASARLEGRERSNVRRREYVGSKLMEWFRESFPARTVGITLPNVTSARC